MIALSLIPSHTVADWLLKNIDRLLSLLGLGDSPKVEQMLYFVIIVAVSLLIGYIIKRLILVITQKLVKIKNTVFGQELLQQRTLTKCSNIIPPLVFLALIPFAFEPDSHTATIIMRIAVVYTLCMFAVGINAVLTFAFKRYNDKENTRNLPLKGVLNIARGVVWAVIIISSVSVIVDKSPAVLLTGLTAFAAALMLVFKDTILGFVAGIQMSQNDMLHVGDWIVVKGTEANGVVRDVSLTTVKVQNFDNTIVMVPPYTLVSTSFRNYRGMYDSGVRRIAMSLMINPTTVKPISPESIDALSAKYDLVKQFVDRMTADKTTIAHDGGTNPINGTTETNLGLYRGYMVSYLVNSPLISNQHNIMVRIMDPTSEGIPLQIYAFAATTVWTAYEAILSAVLEHAMAVAPDFGLEIYAGTDISVRQPAPTEPAQPAAAQK